MVGSRDRPAPLPAPRAWKGVDRQIILYDFCKLCNCLMSDSLMPHCPMYPCLMTRGRTSATKGPARAIQCSRLWQCCACVLLGCLCVCSPLRSRLLLCFVVLVIMFCGGACARLVRVLVMCACACDTPALVFALVLVLVRTDTLEVSTEEKTQHAHARTAKGNT